jgi:hypothetical protein
MKFIKTSGRQCFLTPIGHEHFINLVSSSSNSSPKTINEDSIC